MTRHQWRRPEGKKGGLLREEKSRLGTGRTSEAAALVLIRALVMVVVVVVGGMLSGFKKKSEPWSLRLQYVLRAPHIGWAG